MMGARRLLYIFTQGPYSNSDGQEGLDAMLIGAAFEQEVSVLFMHDGVFQIKQSQTSIDGAIKIYTKAFSALADFGVEQVFVHDLSLLARGLTPDQLGAPVKLLGADEIKALIAQQFRVFTF